jgi:uncharacterized circularly permuted ATP-grasp superfamily protein/uncharacterized alpha-E superfamily protein
VSADPVAADPAGDGAAGVVSGYAGGLGGRNEGEASGTGLDEMLDPQGAVRTAWTDLATQLDWAGPAGLIARSADTRRLLADDGVSYRPPDGSTDQPWALDPLPVLFDAGRWTELAAGLAQRALLLDRLLADLYGPRRTLRSGLLPPELVLGHAGYLRGWSRGPDTPPRRELFLAGADVARTEHGWQLISDRVQAPSGAGYAMANRRVVARVLPAVHRRAGIAHLRPFFDAVRSGLLALAPDAERPDGPRVVLLTPGPQSETAFEQALLSSLLGFPLVLGSELTVRDGRVWQRAMGRLEPVDVILRRVDAAWCDPLDLRQGSRLGVPGLLEAARLGTVAVVNGIGSGVIENPGLLPYLPALAEALLDETLALPAAATWWCGEPSARAHVLARLPELLIKPIARGDDRATAVGSELSAAERAELAARIEAEPYAWVGQQPLRPSTAPVITPDGRLDPRPVVLRAFAVARGDRFEVLDGALASAAGAERPADGRPSEAPRRGTVAKDVWVLGPRVPPTPLPPVVTEPGEPTPVAPPAVLSPRVAADMFWLGRYAERAEGTARLLRAVTDRWADFQDSPEPAGRHALETLLRATTAVTATAPGFLGAGAGRRLAEPGAELVSLITDRDREGTLAFAVHRLTAAAQAVREQLSTDTWLVLGRLDAVLGELAGTTPESTDLSGALSRVLEGLLALAGLSAESLVRDSGWCLLDAGRRIERAQHVAVLIAGTLCDRARPGAEDLVTESVLITAESVITYRRRRRPGPDAVLELLLTDRTNPRALAYQVERLHADVAGIPGAGSPDEVEPALAAVERRLADVRPVALARRDAAGTRPGLRALVEGLSGELTRFADVLEQSRFAPGAPPRPLGPMAVVGR